MVFRKLKEFLLSPLAWYKKHRLYKQRLKQLKERDPFIYK